MVGTMGDMVALGVRQGSCGSHALWEAWRKGFRGIWGFCDLWKGLWRPCYVVTIVEIPQHPWGLGHPKQRSLHKLRRAENESGSNGGKLAKSPYLPRIWQRWSLNVKHCHSSRSFSLPEPET